MGVLVAQTVEDQAKLIRQRSGSELKLRLKQARVKWLRVKGRSSAWCKAELCVGVDLIRADAKVTISLKQMVRNVVAELEKIRRSLMRAT
jgi:hypothetical protein